MKPAPFEYHVAGSVEEACDLLARLGEDAKVIAGGQSLSPLLNLRLARPAALVDINRVSGLDGISLEDGHLVTGALVRHRAAERSPEMAAELPLVAEAMPWVGHPTIRNRGTLGGSLCHADPAAELPCAAVALGAELVLWSPRGSRTVPAAQFFVSLFTTVLAPDELLTEIRWPRRRPGTGWAWIEFAPRHGDYALVGVAAAVETGPDGTCTSALLACSGVGETPVLLPEAAAHLAGAPLTEQAVSEAGELAAGAVSPSSDLMASADYKKRLVRVLAGRALKAAHQRATQENL